MTGGPPDATPASPAARLLADLLSRPGGRDEAAFEDLCAEHPGLEPQLRLLWGHWSRIEERAGGAREAMPMADLFQTELDSTAGGNAAPGNAAQGSSAQGSSSPGSSEEERSDLLERLGQRQGGYARYEIEDEVARGSQGAVMRVWDLDLRRRMAMKVAHQRRRGADDRDRKMLARFLDEAQVTGQLDHPGIVPVHEIGLDPAGRVYFTMRFVEGQDLRVVLANVRRNEDGWTRMRALGVLSKVCEAMAFAHDRGVVHRDLKPSNVMVGRFGEVYVMDWGLARVEGHEDPAHDELRERSERVSTDRQDALESGTGSPLATMDGDIVGTPHYMPPEQARGELDRIGPRSDVYTVGAMLYELLAGRPPYADPKRKKRAPHEVLVGVLRGPPAPVHEIAPDTPAELVAICEKAMDREPNGRYADMGELGEDLTAFLEHRVVHAYETGAIAEFRKWVDRNRGTAAAIGAAILLALGGLAAVDWVQSRRNAELSTANQEVRAARDAATAAAADALRETERARAAHAASEWQTYLANVAAADLNLELGEPREAARRLEACPEELRGWEWRHLVRREDGSIAVLEGHEASVLALAASPGGSLLASGSADRSARLWDVATGEERARWSGLPGTVRCVTFDADGKRLVVGTDAGSLHAFDVASGAAAETVTGDWVGHHAIVLSPDGTVLATGSLDGPEVLLWDARTGTLLRQLAGQRARVASLAFDPSGRHVACGSGHDLAFGNAVCVWEVASGRLLATFEAEGTDPVGALAFDPEGASLRFGGRDSPLVVAGAESGRVARTLEGIHPAVLAFGPGARVAMAAADGTIAIRDETSDALLARIRGHRGDVRSLAFAPDGSWIASGSDDHTVRLWDAATLGERATRFPGHRDGITALAGSRDGSIVATAGADRRIHVRSAATGRVTRTIGPLAAVPAALALAPDGSGVAAALEDGTTFVWDVATGAVLFELPGHEAGARDIDWSPDGATLVTASQGQRGWRRGPGGGLVPFGHWDEDARVWDAATGELIETLSGHDSGVRFARFAPDGATLVTATPALLRLWDAQSLELVREIEIMIAPPLTGLALHPTGPSAVLALHDHSIAVVDLETGKMRATSHGHAGAVSSVAFDASGQRIASASEDGTIRLWDTHSGDLVVTMPACARGVACAEFDPAGHRILAGGSDGVLSLWESDADAVWQTWRAAAERRVLEPIVEELFEQHLACADVLAALDRDPALGPEERDVARGLALERGDPTAAELDAQAWRGARAPRVSPERLANALLRAEAACAMEPDDEGHLATLGAVLCRAGRHQEALETLRRSRERQEASGRTPRAATALYLALAHHALGYAGEARSRLEEARALLADTADTEALELLREVESQLASDR